MMKRWAACLGAGALLVAGCAHQALDPVDAAGAGAYEPPAYHADHEPWGRLAIRHVDDRRPARELGTTNYLKESYYSESFFTRSVPATLKRLFLRELTRSGVFRAAGSVEAARYTIDLTIHHFYSRADRDLLGLIPVVPSIDLDSRIDIHVLLLDEDGRRFVDRRFRRESSSTAATIMGVESTAGDLLLQLLGELMAEVVPACDAAIPAFWAELGMAVPER